MKPPNEIISTLRRKLVEASAEAFEDGRKQESAAYRKALAATMRSDFSAQPIEDGVSLLIKGSSGQYYHADWSTCQCEHGVKGRKAQDGESRYMCWHVALVRAWISAYVFLEALQSD